MISVLIQTEEPHIVFQVKDTSKGIPEQELERIFERFYRVDTSNANQVKGTELGLSIAKHIILQHDGKIWEESEVGAGSECILFRQKSN